MRTRLLIPALTVVALNATTAQSSKAIIDSAAAARTAWRTATNALRTGDTTSALREVERANNAWPAQEFYGWARVVLSAATHDTTRLITALNVYGRMGFGRDIRSMKDFAPLLTNPRTTADASRIQKNAEPLVRSKQRMQIGDSSYWAEGVDIDPRNGRAYIADVHHRLIVEAAIDGKVLRTLPARGTPNIGAMLGVRIDVARGVLWATTSGIPQMANYTAADSSIASLLRIRLSDGTVEKRWDLKPVPGGHVLGDVVVASNGDVFMTDSNEPVLYRLRSNADSLERFTNPLFRSLQGMAPTPDGRFVYVADYSHGLMRVDLQSRGVIRLTDAQGWSSLGCDGIVLYRGSIIAVQNGSEPRRIIQFTLDETGTRLVRGEVLDRNPLADEPTIGTLLGDEFVYVANSQWDKHDEEGAPVAGTHLKAPVLLSIRLK